MKRGDLYIQRANSTYSVAAEAQKVAYFRSNPNRR